MEENCLTYPAYYWIMVPFCSVSITVLALVVPNTRYNSQVPVLIGTTIIEKVKNKCPADKVSEIPSQWNNAFFVTAKWICWFCEIDK